MNSQRLEELLIAWEEDSLTPEELGELKHLLATEPLARRRLVEAGVFRGVAKSHMREWGSARQMPSGGAKWKSSAFGWLSWRPLAAAAVVVLAAVATWHFSRPTPATDGVIAEVVESRSAVPATKWSVGSRVKLREFSLAQGSVRLRLESGVLLDLAAPVEARFESSMRLRLRNGKVNADVGEHGKGFTVVTSAGEVVDLGTRFEVEAEAGGSTDVAVLSGQVRVQARDVESGTETLLLNEGEAVRLVRKQRAHRLSSRQIERNYAALESTGASSVIAEVSDNIAEDNFRRFYGIVSGGMTSGALAYMDRKPIHWMAESDAAFPDELQDADLVRPFHFDRHKRDLHIRLTLTRPAMVYVLQDARRTPPAWLTRDFTDTGASLRCGPWAKSPFVENLQPDANGEYFVRCAVWRRVVPGAGTVELGPPYIPGEASTIAMFGIAVKAL